MSKFPEQVCGYICGMTHLASNRNTLNAAGMLKTKSQGSVTEEERRKKHRSEVAGY